MSFRSWLNRMTSRTATPSRPRRFRPQVEPLEDRLVLSTCIWSGGSLKDSNWTTAANWKQGNVPTAGDDLFFPAGASRRDNRNNFAPNTQFHSIRIVGSGYTLGGNAVSLGQGGLRSVTDDATNTVALALALPDDRSFFAAEDATLVLAGDLRGAGGLIKVGTGEVHLDGGSANTYAGATRVVQGTLLLDKDAGATAVPGELVIGSGDGGEVVRLLAANQIANTAAVTVRPSSQLDLRGFSDKIGALSMTGGKVTGTGTLTLNGDVTATSAAISASVRQSAIISADVSLGTAGRTFTVNKGLAVSDLFISGVISGGAGAGLTKAGAGTLVFTGTDANTYAGTTTVNAGTLFLNKSDEVTAVAGPLVIGGETGGTAVVTTAASASQQLGSRSTKVTVNSTGQLRIGGVMEIIPSLTMTGGHVELVNSTSHLEIGGVLTATSADTDDPAEILGPTGSALICELFVVPRGADPSGPDLIISAGLSGASIVEKRDTGTLRLEGEGDIDVGGSFVVTAGVLELAKPAGHLPVIGGPLVIGAGTGGSNAATVRLLQPDQIRTAVTVNRDGLLDLNNQNATSGALTLTGGRVTTGTGLLTLGGDVTVSPTAATDPAARISGLLSLGAADRKFDVGGAIDQPPTLIVDAVISGDAGVGLTKVGAGIMEFAGTTANTYTGTTTVIASVLQMNKSSGTAVNGKLVIGAGAGDTVTSAVRLMAADQVAGNAAVKVNSDGLLQLNGHDQAIVSLELIGGGGVLTQTVIGTGSVGTLTLNGDVTATPTASRGGFINGRLDLGTAARTFTVNPGSELSVNATTIAPAGLIKQGAGTLAMSGGSDPSAVAATVNGGTLRLSFVAGTTVQLNAGDLQVQGAVQSLTTGTDAAKTVRVGPFDPNRAGKMTVTDPLTFSSSTTFRVKLGNLVNPDSITGIDRLEVSGKVNLNGAKLEGVGLSSFAETTKGTSVRIITGSSLEGEFSNAPKSNPKLVVPVNGSTQQALFTVVYAADGVDLVFEGVVT